MGGWSGLECLGIWGLGFRAAWGLKVWGSAGFQGLIGVRVLGNMLALGACEPLPKSSGLGVCGSINLNRKDLALAGTVALGFCQNA